MDQDFDGALHRLHHALTVDSDSGIIKCVQNFTYYVTKHYRNVRNPTCHATITGK